MRKALENTSQWQASLDSTGTALIIECAGAILSKARKVPHTPPLTAAIRSLAVFH